MTMRNILILIICLTLFSCDGQKGNKDSNRSQGLPPSQGQSNEVLVVMDTMEWNGPLGRQIREVFGSQIPLLPQPEPYFKLRNINPLEFNTVLQKSKNIIFVTTFDVNSAQTRRLKKNFTEASLEKIRQEPDVFKLIKKDEFARDQIVLHLFGETSEDLIQHLEENEDDLLEMLVLLEQKRLRQEIYGENYAKDIAETAKKQHGFTIRYPFGYQIAENKEDFFWVRDRSAQTDKNIWVTYKPYTNESQFQPDSILSWRAEVAQKYILGNENPDSYMITEMQVEPSFAELNFNDLYAIETRGLWRLKSVIMGGPFLSYTFVNEEQGRIYYIEGFIYSPGTKKGRLIKEIEVILHTFEAAK